MINFLYTKKRSEITAMIIKDQILFLGRRYIEQVQEKETFDFYDEWKNIRPLLYEISQNKDGDISIYRIEL